MSLPTLLAVDWGNGGLRAWLLDADGRIVEAMRAPIALKDVEPGTHEAQLLSHCRDWLAAHPALPVVLAGMIGGRGNWHEAPYVACPVVMGDLVAQAVRFSIGGHDALILPGATCHAASGAADVMRGEEVQILGAARLLDIDNAVVCIPGTHAKWARLANGALAGFSTYVTGEMYQLLRQHGLVGRLAEGDDFDAGAFRRGLDRGRAGALLNIVFSARADALTGGLEPKAVSSYLSGLLLGTELGAALPANTAIPIVLMASGVLAERYALALEHFQVPFQSIDAVEAKRAGLAMAAALVRRHDTAVPA